MWYLPIKDRLKRLYQSEKTAAAMRWHAEHTQKEGEINHPSDAKAWKHLNSVYPDLQATPATFILGSAQMALVHLECLEDNIRFGQFS